MILLNMKALVEAYIQMFAPQDDVVNIPDALLLQQINLESDNHFIRTKSITGVKLMLVEGNLNRYSLPIELLNIDYLNIGSERYYKNEKIVVKETSIDWYLSNVVT